MNAMMRKETEKPTLQQKAEDNIMEKELNIFMCLCANMIQRYEDMRIFLRKAIRVSEHIRSED